MSQPDKVLKKFMRSWQFQRLSKPEQMLELREYKYQSERFKQAQMQGC